jgi:hypothetical protein
VQIARLAPTAIRPPIATPAAPMRAAPTNTSTIPGPELPPVAPRHPALPSPPPGLAQLAALAANAPADARFPPGAHPSTIRNAHYTNTRAQLAHAFAGPYNSIEGDVRLRDGRAVMQHDRTAAHDLTFEQWAMLGARAGKHLRIDLKEPAALSHVVATLQRLGVEPGMVTFNVGLRTPWSSGLAIDEVRTLRDRFDGAWVTLNLPAPLGAGYVLVEQAARAIGGPRLGVAVVAGLVRAADVTRLRRSFAVVNAWNLPVLGPGDLAREAARLRAIGVNGMLDLRRRDDPLADD